MRIEPFPERYRQALDNPTLRQTLLQFQRHWRANRDAAVAGIDWDADRTALKAAKDDVIARLPEVLERFTEAASSSGAIVRTAGSGPEVIEYIQSLAIRHGLSRVVKSKSMTSEEIDLNEGLEAAGLQVTETDLGEWIVQLAGERPSHIVGPALHKNRREVAELFERVTGTPVDREFIPAQIAVAREQLRERFQAGEIGISGANALIAETGTIMVVTNEGNAELVTSIPRVHVVVAGIDKLLNSIDEALLELRLLSASATGQPATSYVSWISGPGEPGRELHIVLLDNGRTAMRQRPEFRDALRCVRCGACSSVCPSYGVVGGHVFGYIYSGAIGLVNTPFHNGLVHDAGPQSLCVSCNACQTVCPVDIPLPRQILDTRHEVATAFGLPRAQRIGLELWSRPAVARAALRAATIAQKPFVRDSHLQLPVSLRQTGWRTPPALAGRPFHATPSAGDRTYSVLPKLLAGTRTALFIQCLTDWFEPDIARSVVQVLTALGAEVVVPAGQHCCGLPAHDCGAGSIAQRMARQTIESLERAEADWIVTAGTSCAVAVQHEYPHLFRHDPEWRHRAQAIGARFRDFTQFITQGVSLPPGILAGRPISAAYHNFCQSWNVLGIRTEPTYLLRDVCGIDLVPLPESQVCCGFGGSVSLTRPDISRHILQRKLANIDSSGAHLLITDNPGCIMHLRGGIEASGRRVEVRHTAQIVADRIRELSVGVEEG